MTKLLLLAVLLSALLAGCIQNSLSAEKATPGASPVILLPSATATTSPSISPTAEVTVSPQPPLEPSEEMENDDGLDEAIYVLDSVE